VEDRWKLAVLGLKVGVWEYNFTTQEAFFSDRWKEILGHTPEEVGGRREEFWSRIHPDDLVGVETAMAAHLEGRRPFYMVECRMRCKDGRHKWVRSRGQAQFDPAGRPQRMVGAHADIDESRRAEAALRETEERYHYLTEHSSFGIVEHDYRAVVAWLEGLRTAGVADLAAWLDAHPAEAQAGMAKVRTLRANPATLRLVGAASLEEMEANLPRIFAPGKIGLRRENLLALWSGRLETGGELTMRALDGVIRRIHHHWWVPVIGGRPQHERTQLTLVDLTEIRAAETALAAEREQLDVTLHAMAEGVITTDANGVVRFLNGAAAGLTGWAKDAGVGRQIDEVCWLRHEQTRAVVAVPVAAALAARALVELPPQTALVDRHGGTRLVEGRCAPIHDPQGRAAGVVLVLRDTTQRARLEADLARASKLESIGLLAGGIAHDFNNILTVIMGNLALAAFELPPGSPPVARLRDAEQGLLRARDLTRQLLTFAKGGEPVLDAVNLGEVVRDAAQFALHGAKARLEYAIPEDLWIAQADKGQLGQVVQNLVLNAAQAMPDGGTVRLALRNETVAAGSGRPLAAGDYLRLEITDQGPGIAAAHLARIFEPYFTTKPAGSGLGLATVYSIIRRHQGHIEVESPPGRGATFRCWLPAAPAARAETRKESGSPFPPARGVAGRLLFMDDEEPIRLMALALLARLGFAVVVAPDGAEAVRLYCEARARGEPFDLVIMDLTVPGGMGGKEAMMELQELDPGVRAIVSSGYSSDPVMANHRAHGFRGMVPKPYKFSDLAKTVRAVLEEPSGQAHVRPEAG
jgi:PAS domain S-box-containing protein